MRADVERTLSNLHVIGALSHNDKLMTNEDAFDIYTPTTVRGLVRSWYSEGRGQNVARIRSTVRGGIDFAQRMLTDIREYRAVGPVDGAVSVNTLRRETMELQFRRMVDGLRRAGDGLLNLVHTYRDDAALCSQIRMIVDEISDFVEVMVRNASRTTGGEEAALRYPLLAPPPLASPDAASNDARRTPTR